MKRYQKVLFQIVAVTVIWIMLALDIIPGKSSAPLIINFVCDAFCSDGYPHIHEINDLVPLFN